MVILLAVLGRLTLGVGFDVDDGDISRARTGSSCGILTSWCEVATRMGEGGSVDITDSVTEGVAVMRSRGWYIRGAALRMTRSKGWGGRLGFHSLATEGGPRRCGGCASCLSCLFCHGFTA